MGIKKEPTISGLSILHTIYLMVDLETITTLASMTCIADLDAYELHPEDEKMFNNFINECCSKHIKSIK